MKKTIMTMCFMMFLTGPGFSGEKPETETITVEQITGHYFDALGGLEKIKTVQTKNIVYTVHMQTLPPYRVELKINRKGELKSARLQGDRYLFFDGRKLWNVQGETRSELEGPVVEQFRKKADLDGPLADYREKGISLRYLGKERIEFSWFLKLEVTWPDKVSHILYFDQQSGLLLKKREPAFRMVDGKISRAGDTITCFFDYREVNGVKIPFSWVQTTDDLGHVHLFTVESAEIR